MRSYPTYYIVLLCLAILAIDSMAFYRLQSITAQINNEHIKQTINIVYWLFTSGLITSILILKIRIEKIHPARKQFLISSLYGLTILSFIPKLIFVIVITISHYGSLVFDNKESAILISILGLFAGFLPFFVIIYAIFKAVYRFKIYHIKIKCNLLPEELSGLRIVQISDIHLGNFNYRYQILERAVRYINHLKPDFIFFTGDLVNNYAWETKGWTDVFKKMEARYGKYAVLGNHDYGDYSSWESEELKHKNLESIKYFFKKINFKLLLNESRTVLIKNNPIAIIGVENWGNPPFKQYGDLKKALNNTNNISFKILLSHDPSHWTEEVVNKTDIALTLSGHTHGMQAGVNFRSKQWSPIQYKYKHWAGLHQEGRQYLYVNRGLGWLGFPGRLGMRPEITLIEMFSK